MYKRRPFRAYLIGVLAALLATCAVPGVLAQPRSYPRSYTNIIDAARTEGKLVVYSTTDKNEINSLLELFQQQYPFLEIDYHDLGSRELYQRVLDDAQEGGPTGDLAWSSAMDLQIKLVNDGYAQPYASPEKPNLPAWAIWKNEAYGVTAEPVVFAYNNRFVPAEDVPQSHTQLARELRSNSALYKGKIATFDPALSGVGYLTFTQDYQANRELWNLARALGAADVNLYQYTRPMLESVASGENILAYNVIGSYALAWREKEPHLEVVMPNDYTLVVSRIAIILNEAHHPNAAKLFLDFLLSHQGQTELSRHFMAPAREDVSAPESSYAPAKTIRPVLVGPTLLINQDQIKRKRFLRDWSRSLSERTDAQ